MLGGKESPHVCLCLVLAMLLLDRKVQQESGLASRRGPKPLDSDMALASSEAHRLMLCLPPPCNCTYILLRGPLITGPSAGG